MTLLIDVFWSFRSPFSYLVTPRLVELVETYDVQCRFRPVYPIALRIEGFFKKQSPLARSYFLLDAARVAEKFKMPFVWPRPDPIQMDFQTGEVFREQPYIKALTCLGVAAGRRNRGIQFAKEVSALIFGGTDNWDQGDHLAQASARAKLRVTELELDINEKAELFEARF